MGQKIEDLGFDAPAHPDYEIDYPRKFESGEIITRGNTVALRRIDATAEKAEAGELPELAREHVGGVDWTFETIFGTVEEGVRMVEAIVKGQGDKVDKRWALFLLAYRNRYEMATALGKEPPSLNSICHVLKLPAREFIDLTMSGFKQMQVTLARMKASIAAPQVMESAIQAAHTLEGGKDRELVLKVAGVIEEKGGGVNVNVNQQVGMSVKVQQDELKNPLRQFRTELMELDEMARDNRAGDGGENVA